MKRSFQWTYFLPVLLILAVGISAGLISPAHFRHLTFSARDLIVSRAGWCYILIDALFLISVLIVGFGPWGRIKLGTKEQSPDFTAPTWFALMFCTALAAGLVFFGVAEPLFHYAHPPAFAGVEGRTDASAQWAMVNSFFHWGFNAWCIYLIIPIPLAYLVHRQGLPCRISSALHPLIGQAIHGWIGKAVDGLCVLVSVGGIAVSLGYIGLQLTGGIHYTYGIETSGQMTLLIIAFLTTAITLSAVSGLHRGIKMLSKLNVRLALLLLVFVFLTGPTLYILQLGGNSLKEYLWTEPFLTFRMMDGEEASWINQWTVMYYAWWFSWAPMVGLFYVRVSRGRTIRELILAALFAPVAADVVWFAVFGGSSIYFDLYQGAEIATVMTEHGMQYPIFALLHQLPLTEITIPLFLLLIAVFFITTGDSSSMAISILSSGGDQNPPIPMRVFWCAAQGATAAVLISMGGIEALQAASIVAGFLIVFLLLTVLVATAILLHRIA